jgi:peptidoglycan hydrolase-like protein with peptidoglycan-binding domain
MMKRGILSLVVLSIALILYISFYEKRINTPQDNQQTMNTLLSQDLDENSSGQQVAILQSALRSDSPLYTGEVSGFYTLTTIDAVKRFQKKYLLSPTGKVDLITRLKFNEIFGEGRSIGDYINSKNGEIKKWGMATKVEGTRYGWSMRIENDFHMGTIQELFGAINAYRLKKDKSKLEWSDRLALFAQKRADELMNTEGLRIIYDIPTIESNLDLCV